MKKLKDVTLVAVTTQNVEAAIAALDYSRKEIDFGQILLVSNHDPSTIKPFYRSELVRPFTSNGDWGNYIVFKLHKLITTKYILLIHEDGFVVNPSKWNDAWRKYDYIGAPFPLPRDNFSYRDAFGNIIRVGNSVSLRSKRILELPSEIGLKWDDFDGGFPHEDGFLCVQNRHILSQHGIKYAPINVAVHFAREVDLPEHAGIDPFCFHKWSGPNKIFPCFHPKEVRQKKWWRFKHKLRDLFKS